MDGDREWKMGKETTGVSLITIDRHTYVPRFNQSLLKTLSRSLFHPFPHSLSPLYFRSTPRGL